QDALDRDKPFLQPNRVPDGPPELNALLDIAVMNVLRTDFEKPRHCPNELRRWYAECLAYASDGRRRNVSAGLDVIQLSVANNDLIRRQIVVNIGEMNREHLIPQE